MAKFETSFEECAPTRNSGANEWSAFGAIGNMDFNCMGRELWVRYPVFDLVFRLYEGDQEIEPGQLPSFRLGLVNDRMPGIWGGWQHDGLLYKVSVMTIPDREAGQFRSLQAGDPEPDRSAAADQARCRELTVRPTCGWKPAIVRGLGAAPFLVADPPVELHDVAPRLGPLRQAGQGVRDRSRTRARRKPAIGRYRAGWTALPVVYRFKAERDKKYVVYLAATPHIGGYHLAQPKKSGDLVYEYCVEGCAARRSIGTIGSQRSRSRCASVLMRLAMSTATATSRFAPASRPLRRSGTRD